jgi:hypothetical protein
MAGELNPIELMIEALKSNIPNFQNLSTAFVTMDDASKSVLKNIGGVSEQLYSVKQSLIESRAQIELMGGSFQDIVKIQNEVSSTLNRNIILQGESFKDLYAASQVTGQDADVLAKSFKDAGFSIYQVSDKMQGVVDIARGMGVNVEAVSKQVINNMDALNKYTFQGGVEGMARMAAQAANLRIDMSSTLNIADNLFDPQKAIDMAASLQRLGVTQSSLLDPLKLMDLAQNDPEELQNQIVKMTESFAKFNSETGKFEIPPGARRQLREIETSLGYSKGELSKMALGSLELSDKMSKIRFPDTFTDEQKKMIANMAEMGKGGEYRMVLDGKSMGLDEALESLKKDPEKFKEIAEASKPKSMEDLIKEQNPILKNLAGAIVSLSSRLPMGVVSSKGATDASIEVNKSIIEVGNIMSNTLTTQGFSKIVDKIGMDTWNSIKNTLTGDDSFTSFLGKLGNSVGDLSDYIDSELKNLKTKYGNTESIKPLIDTALNFDKKMTTQGKDVEISANGKNISLLPEDTLYAGTSPQSLAYRVAEMIGDGGKSVEHKGEITLNINVEAPNLPVEWRNQLAQMLRTSDMAHTISTSLSQMSYGRDNSNPNYKPSAFLS